MNRLTHPVRLCRHKLYGLRDVWRKAGHGNPGMGDIVYVRRKRKVIIDGEKIINFQFYDEEHEEYTVKAMRIIDFLENYSEETVPTIEETAQPDVPDTNVGDTISRRWLMECVNEGWIKFDTEKDENRFVHLVRDIAPSAQSEPRWIPVTERLPKAGVRYQVTFESGEVGYADFRNKIFLLDGSAKENVWETERYYEDDGEVIAWMPLPKRYKRSKNEVDRCRCAERRVDKKEQRGMYAYAREREDKRLLHGFDLRRESGNVQGLPYAN